jgi:hypothetical protein
MADQCEDHKYNEILAVNPTIHKTICDRLLPPALEVRFSFEIELGNGNILMP